MCVSVTSYKFYQWNYFNNISLTEQGIGFRWPFSDVDRISERLRKYFRRIQERHESSIRNISVLSYPVTYLQVELSTRREGGSVFRCRWRLSRTPTRIDPKQRGVKQKNAVFWVVASCNSCWSRHFRGTYCIHHKGGRIQWASNFSSNS